MFWFLFRWLFWQPRYRYRIVVGHSFASADEAARSAELQTNNLGGEAIAIAADGLCCGGGELGPTVGRAEWDVYVLVRH